MPSPSVHPKSQRAFTLTELFVVLVLLSGMLALLAPAFPQLNQAAQVNHSSQTIAGLLEKARTCAMAQNTYVWIGFFNEDAAAPGRPGVGRLIVSVVASRDGTPAYSTDSPGPMDPQRLVSLTNLIRLDHVTLQPSPALDSKPTVSADSSIASTGETSCPFQYPLTGTPQYTFSKVIEITPRGEAVLNFPRSNSDQYIEVGLEPTRGNVRVEDKNRAAILLSVLTGQTKIYRVP